MKAPPFRLPLLATAFLAALAMPLGASLEKLLPEQLHNANGDTVSRDSLEGKIIGVYFSARWCPSCRSFTPSLVKFRDANKADFEVVFVSSDRDARTQDKYMTSYKMQWPAVKYGSPAARNLKKHFKVGTIPTLVILGPDGRPLTTDGRGAVSRNPGGAIAAWKKSSQ